MALNFPLDPGDQQQYIDPVSGLKYIFNASIGGWETAIQPPCIVTGDGTAPDIILEGFLWFDSTSNVLYVMRGGTWTPLNDSNTSATRVTVGQTPAAPSVQGDLWWDTVSGNLYIYYNDSTSSQWVIASPNVGGDATSSVFTGPSAPPNPKDGTIWFNTTTNVLYVYIAADTAWKTVTAEVAGVNSISGNAPIFITGDAATPEVNITNATSVAYGAARFANQSEVTSLDPGDVALNPSRLAAGIDSYLPDATTTVRGVVLLADAAEAAAGTNDEKAITPATLSVAIGASGNPVGTVIMFASETPPDGYLVCDGSLIEDEVSQTIQGKTADFRPLRNILGTVFSPNNSDVLLPDLRGEFIRGYDAGRNVDAGREFGSYQGQSIESHDHTGASGNASTSGGTEGGGNRSSDTGVYTTNPTGGTETRPRNVSLLYCIKY